MNTHVIPQNEPLVYNGVLINDRGEKLSLTDMWRATGSDPQKAPAKWRSLPSAKSYIEHVEFTIGKSDSELIKVVAGGKTPGTWAHWQIGMAYAKYLDHDFHMACNQVVRDRMEGKLIHAGLSIDDKNAIGGIVKSCAGIVIREYLSEMIPQLIEARLAEQSMMVRHGKTAKQIWDAHRLPPRLRGSTTWLGNRLKEMGASIKDDGRFDRGSITIRLFDPDKAEVFLKNGLLHSAKIYASERMGQGKLRLVEGGAQ